MKTVKLYRPIGIKELELIAAADFRAFPPRLEWQPIFYPVLDRSYAQQIASEWNTADEFSGFCGIVTCFELDNDHYAKYDVQTVGGAIHNELWVLAEELKDFNRHIINDIRVINVYFGSRFEWPKNELIARLLRKVENAQDK